MLRLRLSLMMFLNYAAWGAWMPILSATLINRKVEPQMVGLIYSAFWAAFMLAPIGGQLVDRIMPSQIFLGISHLLAAGAAFMMAQQTTSSNLLLWMFIWAFLFAPSVGITNAISFQQIEKLSREEAGRERDFAWIRTAGTIGWIVSAFVLTWYMSATHADPKAITGPIPEMMLTGIMGIIMAVYSFSLPHTPPVKDKKADPFAFRRAFSLFKTVPGFAVFMGISFFAATEFQFFYGLSGQFLESKSIPHSMIPIVKSISQVAEIAALGALLPLCLTKFGMRWCLLIGSFAWPLRYLIFSIGEPIGLVVLSLGLHGFGFAFVMVVQQLYVDRVAPKDIRASAQSLLSFVTLGLGNVLGSYFSGLVQQVFTKDGVTSWVPVFILPTITTLICAIAYMVTFRDPQSHGASLGEAELETIGA